MQEWPSPSTLSIRPTKKRKNDNPSGSNDGTNGQDDATPYQRADTSSRPVSSSIISQSSTHVTPTTKQRRRPQALGLVRIDAPQLAYFRDTFYKAPTVLHKFAVELEAFIDGRHIFWPKLFDEVMEHPLKNGMFRRLAHPAWFSEPGSSYSPPGPSPPCAQLQDLVNAASKCETRRSSEAHWNCVVHYPVLELALKPHSTILDVVNCTSATINTGYPTQLPPSIRGDSKKVDFCIVVDQSGSGCHPAIYDIVTTDSVNHSNHPPLLSCPIAISIETKAAAPNKEEAELQMGVWMAAHFAHLHGLLIRQWDQQPGGSSQMRGQQELGADPRWQQAIEQLGFLPGLIVLQHDWYFIRRYVGASTTTPTRGLKQKPWQTQRHDLAQDRHRVD